MCNRGGVIQPCTKGSCEQKEKIGKLIDIIISNAQCTLRENYTF